MSVYLDYLAETIRAHAFSFSNEEELQCGIAECLERARIAFAREVVLGPKDRVDFFTHGIGIEVKVDGSISAVTRQLHRYAHHPDVRGLLLIASRIRLLNLPESINGKPVRALSVVRAFA